MCNATCIQCVCMPFQACKAARRVVHGSPLCPLREYRRNQIAPLVAPLRGKVRSSLSQRPPPHSGPTASGACCRHCHSGSPLRLRASACPPLSHCQLAAAVSPWITCVPHPDRSLPERANTCAHLDAHYSLNHYACVPF
jgi:hypothetical protein